MACALMLLACEERPRPWAAPASSVVVQGPVPAPRLPNGSWLPDAGTEGGGGGEQGVVAAPETRSGGMWRRCYDGFAPSGTPAQDVARLGAMCGPSNGMRPLPEGQFEGATPGGGRPARHRFQAREGTCYRVFASVARGAGDLDLVLKSPRGSRLAEVRNFGTWPMLEAGRPFCSLESGPLTLELSTGGAGARYAASVWALPR